MEKMEVSVTYKNGRRIIIIPDGFELVKDENGQLVLSEKLTVFDSMTAGDFFVCNNTIYIFKFAHIQPDGNISVVVYGYASDKNFEVEENIFNFNEPVRIATDRDIEKFNSILKKHCYEWDVSSKSFHKIEWFPQYGDTYYEIIVDENCSPFVRKCSFHNEANLNGKLPVFPTEDEAVRWANEFNQMINNFAQRIINEADMTDK